MCMKDLLEAFHRSADRIKMSSTISPQVTLFAGKSFKQMGLPSPSFSLHSASSLDVLKSKIIFQKPGKQGAVNLGRRNNGEMARTPRVRGSNLNVRTFTFPRDLCSLTAGL